MSKPFLILLNGPPGSGKDYAADIIAEAPDLTVSKYKFSEPLKEAACAILEISRVELEAGKNKVDPLFGVTLRQIQIDISEKWMKPCYGKDIFGRIALSRMSEEIQWNDENEEDQPDCFVISDSGFDTEAKVLLQLFGSENVLLIRLSREGKTFFGDSRSYIELDDVRTIDIYNDGNKKFDSLLLKMVKDWINERRNSQGA